MPLHPELAAGRWFTLSLCEQMGNIGSEVSRAGSARAQGNDLRMRAALDRALELFDLTIADPRHRGRLREICRAREVTCEYLSGDNAYSDTLESLNKYFLHFAIAARRRQ